MQANTSSPKGDSYLFSLSTARIFRWRCSSSSDARHRKSLPSHSVDPGRFDIFLLPLRCARTAFAQRPSGASRHLRSTPAGQPHLPCTKRTPSRCPSGGTSRARRAAQPPARHAADMSQRPYSSFRRNVPAFFRERGGRDCSSRTIPNQFILSPTGGYCLDGKSDSGGK